MNCHLLFLVKNKKNILKVYCYLTGMYTLLREETLSKSFLPPFRKGIYTKRKGRECSQEKKILSLKSRPLFCAIQYIEKVSVLLIMSNIQVHHNLFITLLLGSIA